MSNLQDFLCNCQNGKQLSTKEMAKLSKFFNIVQKYQNNPIELFWTAKKIKDSKVWCVVGARRGDA